MAGCIEAMPTLPTMRFAAVELSSFKIIILFQCFSLAPIRIYQLLFTFKFEVQIQQSDYTENGSLYVTNI